MLKMKFIKTIFKLLLLFIVMFSFSRCSSTKKLQNSIPFEIGEAYCQYSVSGVKGEGSGVNLVIHIVSNPNSIILDSVYFRGQQSKIKTINNTIFAAHFQSDTNQKKGCYYE